MARLPRGFAAALLAATGLLLITPSATPAAAQDSDGYRQLLEDAVTEYNAGHWAEARALFRRAHELQPNARTLRGIGMAAFEQREYVDALRALEASLEDERKPLTDEQREHVRGLIERANAFVARFDVDLAPEGAELRVDGAPAQVDPDGTLLLDLGEHELVAECPGCEPERRELEVVGGEERELSFELRRIGEGTPARDEPGAGPPPTSAPGADSGSADVQVDAGSDPVSIALLSSAAVLVGGTIGGAIWWKDRNDEIDRCEGAGSACRNLGALESERNAAIGVTVGLAAAAAALGVTGLVMSLGGDEDDATATATCTPGLGGAACAVAF